MEIMQIRSSGRELTIKFTCCRCEKTEYLPFDIAMQGETYGHLHNSKLPEGWDSVGYSQILCAECAKEYELFMNGGKERK